MKSYQYDQLDADTKAYLRFVRDGKGRGAPGVLLTFGTSRPTWSLIIGLLILPLFLWIGYTSTKAGWAVALLQTAGVFLGGWLILYAFRRWMANPDKYAGHFVYFDPEHVYYGLGEEIQIAKVGRDPTVEPRGENAVRFDTERGAFTVPAQGRVLAQFVCDFYEALKWVRSRNSGPWVGVNAAEAGAVARYLVEEDREPSTLADTGLEAEEIPNQVSTTGPSSGILRYLIVLGAGVAVYALFAFTNPAILDDMAFEDAKAAVVQARAENKGFTGAYALRDYLLNDKHTRHRDEAKKLISELYNGPIATHQRFADDPTEPDMSAKELRAQLVRLLEDRRGPDVPGVSIRISIKDKGEYVELGKEPGGTKARGDQVRSLYGDGFATAVGKDLVVCGEAPSDKKANIEVRFEREGLSNVFLWRVELRTVVKYKEDDEKAPPEAKRYASANGRVTVGAGGNFGNPFGPVNVNARVGDAAFPSQQTHTTDGEQWTIDEPLKSVLCEDDAVYRAVMTKLVGRAPERPMAQ